MTDAQAVALTLFGEARSEQVEGRAAVASVIRNRLHDGRWGDTYEKVCLARRQFSCWNDKDPNQIKLQALLAALETSTELPLSAFELAIFRECQWLADGLMDGRLHTRVGLATHYVTVAMLKADPPLWARGRVPVMTVNSHAFFAGVS